MATAHAFSFPALDGTGSIDLAAYAGNPVLVVNTASACGFTPQYEGLQALWERYRDRGLVVVGVPSNDFGAQEPGTEAEIGAFCRRNYGVTFPLSAKQPVLGAEAHPFYRWLGQELGEAALPRWNFHKVLLGPDGQVAGIHGPRVTPLSDELVSAVEALLPG